MSGERRALFGSKVVTADGTFNVESVLLRGDGTWDVRGHVDGGVTVGV